MSFQAKVNEYNSIRYWNNNPIIADAERQLRQASDNGTNRYSIDAVVVY